MNDALLNAIRNDSSAAAVIKAADRLEWEALEAASPDIDSLVLSLLPVATQAFYLFLYLHDSRRRCRCRRTRLGRDTALSWRTWNVVCHLLPPPAWVQQKIRVIWTFCTSKERRLIRLK